MLRPQRQNLVTRPHTQLMRRALTHTHTHAAHPHLIRAGLNGTILPADGLPGENYMIGVKRGGACTERGDTAVLSVFNNPLSPAPQNRGDKRDALQRGGGVGAQKVHEAGLKGSMSRFLSELFDITDLSIRD
jgi:hypothetical protein